MPIEKSEKSYCTTHYNVYKLPFSPNPLETGHTFLEFRAQIYRRGVSCYHIGNGWSKYFFQAGTVKFFAVMCYFLCMFALLEKNLIWLFFSLLLLISGI